MVDSFHFVGGLGDTSGANDTNGGGGLHSVAGIGLSAVVTKFAGMLK